MRRYYTCSECRKSCNAVERDFGIGGYEFWGARGRDVNLQTVSSCCDATPLTPEEYVNLSSEETFDE